LRTYIEAEVDCIQFSNQLTLEYESAEAGVRQARGRDGKLVVFPRLVSGGVPRLHHLCLGLTSATVTCHQAATAKLAKARPVVPK